MRIGVDIGGTGVRAARVGPGGLAGPLCRRALSSREVDAVLDAVAGAVADAMADAMASDLPSAQDEPRASVGVGVPGFVREGVVLASPNFPTWRSVPLARLLAERLSADVTLENDANAAAYGAWIERGRAGDLVMLTLGTGVGGGVVSGGRLLRGAHGTGAELGHIYAGGDAPCGCGGVGCLETFCSTGGLARLARARGLVDTSAEALAARAAAGDADAQAVFDEAGRALGRGLVTLVNVFDPDRVVLAGGLTALAARLGPIADAWLRAHAISANATAVTIEWAARADDLAILGASALASATTGR